MKTRSLFAAVCILILPFVFSSSVNDKRTNQNQLGTVVYAGHIVATGVWCECDTPECFCEPGEMRTNSQPALNQATNGTRSEAAATSGFDFGAGVMLITLALLLGLRMRF